jgi:hypothetical protein
MTPLDILSRALNGLKHSNLKRGRKEAVTLGAVKRVEGPDGPAIQFKIEVCEDTQDGKLKFTDTIYQIPMTGIKTVGVKEKITTWAELYGR